MDTKIGHVVLECFFDLGVTIVYAALVGLVIVAVVASDDGPASLLQLIGYAALLPICVIVLIGLDIALRLIQQRRKTRRPRRLGFGLVAKLVASGLRHRLPEGASIMK